MNKVVIFVVLVGLLIIAGCATPTQKGAGIGALIGAGAGAIIGHQTGKTAEGALIGGAVGAAAGALIGERTGVKFCPESGMEHTAKEIYCPTHGVELKWKEK